MKEGNKKYPLLHSEAITRKNLLTNEKGEYSVKYNLVLVIRSFIGNAKKDIRGKQKLTVALWDMVAHIVLGLN